jgi:maleylacetate reductase
VIVRWGLGELGPLLEELGSKDPLLVTTRRFAELDLPVRSRFTGVRTHAPVESVAAATEAAASADAVVGLGGGSAIDTAKAVSAATGLPLVAVPTTYAGAEWTAYFGIRDESERVKRGGSGARVVAVVYEPRLTLELPRGETVGTALNALAHAAEALYAGALERSRRISRRERSCSKEQCTRDELSPSAGSSSRTRWHRRSAAVTAFRTVR